MGIGCLLMALVVRSKFNKQTPFYNTKTNPLNYQSHSSDIRHL